ncbi:uncharacterized protein FIBRA_00337 [Fibroporia radiculosa]|uniref:Survival motor neuron Tudor domain-containing protein n=1 Tax=Fibroporia radiculosa TaxID=599839 RepID=J7SCR2_9APHY|nr:uncharacterized protein FIBRA_00337 [Fibroporia radiculosa]CCL98343.1 predicted protein [Fibroporia radiculosa]
MRPVVSYDDITAPQQITSQIGPQAPVNAPPSKKRKPNHSLFNTRPQKQFQHWDDPGSHAPQMIYDDISTIHAEDLVEGGEEEGETVEDESRELTHQEIWDDSALALNGPGSDWKNEAVQPAKRSPLWYNIPPLMSESKATTKATNNANLAFVNGSNSQSGQDGKGDDSIPLNFDTFVPTHDASLSSAVPLQPFSIPGPDSASFHVPGTTGPIVNQDEAFSRALTAMYWGGYYTAVYHYHRNLNASENAEEEDDCVEQGEAEQDEDMMPAQR